MTCKIALHRVKCFAFYHMRKKWPQLGERKSIMQTTAAPAFFPSELPRDDPDAGFDTDTDDADDAADDADADADADADEVEKAKPKRKSLESDKSKSSKKAKSK